MVLGYTRTVSRYSRVLPLTSAGFAPGTVCLRGFAASAMATPTRAANVGLYRKLLKAAQNFEPYNIRDYAVRYVRDDFRAAAVLSGQEVRPVCLRRPQPFL
mgnify:CR=1 FL=1